MEPWRNLSDSDMAGIISKAWSILHRIRKVECWHSDRTVEMPLAKPDPWMAAAGGRDPLVVPVPAAPIEPLVLADQQDEAAQAAHNEDGTICLFASLMSFMIMHVHLS